jgi:hypothetical protein
MILVDSSVWIDYFNGQATREALLLDDLLQREPLLTGDLILAEVLQGFRNDSDFHRARRLMDLLAYRDMAGRDVAQTAVQNYRLLRSRGITVRKTIDLLIGSFCIRNRITLLHSERDFLPMSRHCGLSVL